MISPHIALFMVMAGTGLVLTACGGGSGGGGGGSAATGIGLARTGQSTCYDNSVPPQPVACATPGIAPGQDGLVGAGVSVASRRTLDASGNCITGGRTLGELPTL